MKKVGTVYETNDYSQFKRLVGYRELKESHVQKLIKSFQKNGEFLNPIIVNEKMEIIDAHSTITN